MKKLLLTTAMLAALGASATTAKALEVGEIFQVSGDLWDVNTTPTGCSRLEDARRIPHNDDATRRRFVDDINKIDGAKLRFCGYLLPRPISNRIVEKHDNYICTRTIMPTDDPSIPCLWVNQEDVR